MGGLRPGQRYEIVSSVSLRTRLEEDSSPASMDELGSFVSDIAHRGTPILSADPGLDPLPVRYARSVSEDLHPPELAAGAFRMHHDMPGRLFLFNTPAVTEKVAHDKENCGRIGLCVLSNLGRIPTPLEGYFLGGDNNRVSIVDYGFGQTQARLGADLFLGITTLGDRGLTINVTYTEPLHSTEDVELFLKEMHRNIVSVSESSS